MKKLDLHFHTALSDGVKYSEELLNEIKKEEYLMLTATDHDIVNREFSQWMKKIWFPTVEGVEISVHDNENEIKEYIGKNTFHMTYYKETIGNALDEIFQNTRTGRQEKLQVQIEQLQKSGFNISSKDFYEHRESKFLGKDKSWYNALFLAQYIYLSEENKKIVSNIFWKEVSSTIFLRECLLSHWKYAHIGTKQIDEYEPTLEQLAENIHGWILSIAHPNSTFISIESFLTAAKLLIKKYPINAIEINARADEQRVDAIIEFCKMNWLIITFWSDFHRGRWDETHGTFGETTPHVSEDILKKNCDKFLDKIQ